MISRSTAASGISNDNLTAVPRGLRQSARASVSRTLFDRRLIRYENTYRMEPDGDNRVDVDRLRRLASGIVERAIHGYKYDPNQAKPFSLALADHLRNQIKRLPYQRYKLVVQVSIGQKNGQGLYVASRCVWDIRWDRHMTIARETKDAFITVTLFLVYTE